MEKTITITKSEYLELKKDAAKLACLEEAGVDNWEGYDFAMENMPEDDEFGEDND
jgi:hypothetical protein